jgi:hypothetical protein
VKPLAGLALLLAAPAVAQQSGWSYAPYPGEGDRAALGCAYGSTPEVHSCVAVRCEDDFSVALYLDTTRPGGDTGRWTLQIDKDVHEVTAVAADGLPYSARIEGDVAPIVELIKNGDSFFIDPPDGELPLSRGIGLTGSLTAITNALYFCAPRVEPEPVATE